MIEKIDHIDEDLGVFIDNEFNRYADKFDVTCNYVDFCYAAKDGDKIMGIIVGHSYYKEVHITDLIVKEEYRGQDIGTKLVRYVEQQYQDKGFENINLTTYAFQAPEFYKKLGFEVEYVRKSSDKKLDKYFLIKHLSE